MLTDKEIDQLYAYCGSPPGMCESCLYNADNGWDYEFVRRKCLQNCSTKFTQWCELYDYYKEQIVHVKTNNLRKEISKNAVTTLQGRLFHFITIRPPPKTEFTEFLTDVNHFMAYLSEKTKGYMCHEQSGSSQETLGHGFHVHILVDKYQKKSYMLQAITRKFKYVAKNCIDIKELKEDDYNKVYAYICGQKTAEKQGAVEYNPAWRKVHNLQDIYRIGI